MYERYLGHFRINTVIEASNGYAEDAEVTKFSFGDMSKTAICRHKKRTPKNSLATNNIAFIMNLYPTFILKGDLSPDSFGSDVDHICNEIQAACKGFGTDEKYVNIVVLVVLKLR